MCGVVVSLALCVLYVFVCCSGVVERNVRVTDGKERGERKGKVMKRKGTRTKRRGG